MVFPWSGSYSIGAHEDAAQKLLEFILGYEFKDGEKLNIVGFSHGGNVARLYTQLYNSRKIDVLVNLGTPQNAGQSPYKIKNPRVLHSGF